MFVKLACSKSSSGDKEVYDSNGVVSEDNVVVPVLQPEDVCVRVLQFIHGGGQYDKLGSIHKFVFKLK